MAEFPNLEAKLADAIPVYLAGSNFRNLITSARAQIKTGVGILAGVTINKAGTSSAAILYDGTSSVVTMTMAAPGVISWVDHPFIAGAPVQFTTTGALYTGLTAGTTYYVSTVGLTADAFSVADTRDHALAGTNTIETSGTESGVQTAWDVGTPIGTFSTTAQSNVPIGLNGARFQNGLFAVTSDGGGAADLTVTYI